MVNDLMYLEADNIVTPPNYLSDSDDAFTWRFMDDFNPMDSMQFERKQIRNKRQLTII